MRSMSNSPHEVTAHVVVESAKNLFSMLGEKYGGATTLNELRVINQVILCHIKGRSCSVTALHKETGIPISTVSRTVCNLQREGWISDRQDRTDGRRRIISPGQRSLDQAPGDIEGAIRWINNFREHGLPA